MKTYKLIPLLLILILAACESDSKSESSAIAPGVSKAGSMAAFAINGQYLYALDNNELAIFNIATPNNVTYHSRMKMPTGVVAETLYPFNGYLLIGTQQGVYIFDTKDAANPQYVSKYEHIVSCDPVVANGDYAYSTLRNGNACRGVNELHILDIKNIKAPFQLSTMRLDNPHGLDIDGDILVVCDGKSGFKTINVADRRKPKLIKTVDGFHGYDVITNQKIAIITGEDGIYQYNYADSSAPQLLSKISVVQ